MARKINIFTFLIFVYSVVICLTCKRDFSQNITHAKDKNPTELPFQHVSEQQIVVPNMTANSVVVRKAN